MNRTGCWSGPSLEPLSTHGWPLTVVPVGGDRDAERLGHARRGLTGQGTHREVAAAAVGRRYLWVSVDVPASRAKGGLDRRLL